MDCLNCLKKLEYEFEMFDGWCGQCTAANWGTGDDPIDSARIAEANAPGEGEIFLSFFK